MQQVLIEATNPGTQKVVRKLLTLAAIPRPGTNFHMRDKALDGLICAEEVSPAHGDQPPIVIVHVNNAGLSRMEQNGWSADSAAA